MADTRRPKQQQEPKRESRPERIVLEMPRFIRSKKRLVPKAQLAVDEAVKAILADPLSGEPKSGALKAIRVVKFKVGPQQLLLAYKFDEKRNIIEVWAIGPHENFYRDLQEYMDARSSRGSSTRPGVTT